MELRILVHAPRGRDALVVSRVLSESISDVCVCATDDELLQGLIEGAAAAVVTEESLTVTPDGPLHRWLSQQPTWSDFPFIVLASKQAAGRSSSALASLNKLGNVILLERPLNSETLSSAADSAVRARRRQYATRQHLAELDETRATVEMLNHQLEERIAQRTRELASANDRLMGEIAERERAQAALVQVQKMEAIGRLTGGIAHDFNNLLHVVSMNLDLVSRLNAEPKVAAIAAQAKRAVSRGSKLTGQLLSFARSQSLLPRMTDINALLLGMQELVAVSVGSSIKVRFDLATEPLFARLDPNQLEMAVLNLAVNAKDAMTAGGTLTVSTRLTGGGGEGEPASGDYAVVSVGDDGIGIPQHLLSKVFDPFFTTKGVGSGTGLGLSQVYGFAEQSAGRARIASEVGHGTVVEMFFPIATDADILENAPPQIAPAATVPEHHSILVVEDDPDVRRVISESLRLGGHTVTEACDGIAGLAALAKATPDLLIVDYAMPGLNGAEVIVKARQMARQMPVILATGYADMVEVGRVLGTQSILIKPFDIATLNQAVAQALSAAPGVAA